MNRDPYKQARKNVKKKKGFFMHLGIYLTMAVFFFIINFMDGLHDIWFVYPIASWGIAISIHYISVFGIPFTNILSQEWEDREMDKEISRLAPSEEYEELDLNDDLELPEMKRQKQRIKHKPYNENDLV